MAGNQRIVSERNKSQTEKTIKVKMIAFAGWQLWVEGQVSLKTTALMMEDVSAPSADSSPGRNWSQSAVFRVFTLTAIQLLLADDVQWSDKGWARLNSIKRFIRGSQANPAIELLSFFPHISTWSRPTIPFFASSNFRGEKYEKK